MPGAEGAAQLAERPVRHAGHRRDEHVVRQEVGADALGEGRTVLPKKEARL
jgi:hypothetical protein